MKLRYIITAFVSALALAACQTEPMVGSFADFSVDKTFVSIPLGGGSSEVNITASDSWVFTKHYDTGKKDDNKQKIYSEHPDWISISALSGNGNAKITISATPTESGREVELQIKSGDHLQHLIVRQGTVEAVDATCKDVMEGPDGKNFKVRAKVTKIANTTYGNLYLDDGTYTAYSGGNADGVYVYGTLDADGKEKNFESLGIEVGDIITVSGPKSTYNGTVELVNVTVHKIEKALVKVISVPAEVAKEGGDVEITVAYKGKGVYASVADEAKDWIIYKNTAFKAGVATIFEKSPADTAVITFTVQPNPMVARQGIVNLTSSTDDKNSTTQSVTIIQEGAINTITSAEFNALEDADVPPYRIKGVVTRIVMDKDNPNAYNQYGNFDVSDETGTVYVYGLLPEPGGEAKQDVLTKQGVKLGDVITVVGPKSSYNGAPQMKNAYYESHTSVTTTTADKFNALADGEDLYLIKGAIQNIAMDKNDNTKYNKYGNFDVVDETGKVYVYGIVPVSTEEGGQDILTTRGVKEGDIVTVVGPKASYNGSPQMKNGYLVSVEPGEGPGPGPEDTFDYTPSAAYNAAGNLWKANAAGNENYYYYNATGDQWNGTDVISKDVPFLTVNQSTYELSYPEATYSGIWQKQFFIFPDEGHFVALDAAKTYNLKITLSANKDTPAFFKIEQYDANHAKREGACIWEKGEFNLTANTPVSLEQEITGVSCENVNLVFAFGGNPADTKIYIKDIILTEVGGEPTPVKLVTVADFIAAPESDTQVYQLVGTISGLANTTYGNFDLVDATGSVYVYGLTATELGYGEKNDKSFGTLGLEEGDKIVIKGYRGSFKDKVEVMYAWFVEKVSGGATTGITIDGDFSDWEGIEGVSNGSHGMFKAASDAENLYFYTWRTTEGRFGDLWGAGKGYVYFAFDLDGDETNGVSLNSNGPYDFIGFIYCFGGTPESPVIEITADGDCAPAGYTVANVTVKGVVDETGAKLEYSIPRADLPTIPNTPITITSWGNKDLAKVVLNCTL